MAFGTLFYAGAAIVQICIMRENAQDASSQTDKLIKAAQAQACAAKSFAASAANINAGIGTAVDKLNLQADATKKLAVQAQRSADTSQNIFEAANRPYVGVTGIKPIQFDTKTGECSAVAHLKNFRTVPATEFWIKDLPWVNNGPHIHRYHAFKNTIFLTEEVTKTFDYQRNICLQIFPGQGFAIHITIGYTWPNNKQEQCQNYSCDTDEKRFYYLADCEPQTVLYPDY
jgi:hypothetical protein